MENTTDRQPDSSRCKDHKYKVFAITEVSEDGGMHTYFVLSEQMSDALILYGDSAEKTCASLDIVRIELVADEDQVILPCD